MRETDREIVESVCHMFFSRITPFGLIRITTSEAVNPLGH